jgi:deoxyguanosine kinase
VNMHPYVAIEGPIGIGKTTLAHILGDGLPAEVLLEVFEQNPFLDDFYGDRDRYAFQTQIFFLLSRYHQQHRVIAATLAQGALVSDYLFAKDWLFAHLNLAGDELAMYERVHAILGEQIPPPDLVVHLRASTDTLMQRIAFRDRPYERQMDREYINALRVAYEEFFNNYTIAPVLTIETEDLDFVRDIQVRSSVVTRVRGALQAGAYQPRLLDTGPPEKLTPLAPGSRLSDWQRFQRLTEADLSSQSGMYFDYLTLAARLGTVGQVLARAWQVEDQQLAQVGNRREAREQALAATGEELQDTLVEALKQILRMANDAGINLESAYLRRTGQS